MFVSKNIVHTILDARRRIRHIRANDALIREKCLPALGS
jgi:hypothetical protein